MECNVQGLLHYAYNRVLKYNNKMLHLYGQSTEDALMYFKFNLIKKKLFFQNPSRFKQF